MSASYSISFSGYMGVSGSQIRVGYGVSKDADGNFVEATDAARVTRPFCGVALTAADTINRSFSLQQDAWVPAGSVPGVGEGVRETAVLNASGQVVRISAHPSGEVIGTCDEDGDVLLRPPSVADGATDGGVEIPMTGDTTVTPDDAARRTLRFTGSPAADSVATFPSAAAIDDAIVRSIRNDTDVAIILSTATGDNSISVLPGTSATIEVDENGIRQLNGGFYDPRDFGAKFDGEHDDLAALDAMHAAMPSTGGVVKIPHGLAWLSDTWRVSKPVEIVGQGGIGFRFSGFKVAPGRTCLRLDYTTNSVDGNDSSWHHVHHLDFVSQILIHGTANGSALARGIHIIHSAGLTLRKGDCVIASGGASPTKCFRVTDTGAGDDPGAFGASEPTWNTTLGATTSSNGVTFTCESLIHEHQVNHAYVVGDRVWAPNDWRFIFECTDAGTSAGTRPNELKGGDETVGVSLGATVTDGGVVWLVYAAAGILRSSSLGRIEQCTMHNFSGYALHDQSNWEAGETIADNNRAREITVYYCGGGHYLQGADVNGWTSHSLWCITTGTLHPNPNTPGNGGHGINDRSLAGGSVIDLYVQTNYGRAVLKAGLGRTVFISCFQETSDNCLFQAGGSTIIGGTIAEDAPESGYATRLANGDDYGYFHHETDTRAGYDLKAALIRGNNQGVFPFSASEGGDTNFWAMKYAYNVPAGWFGMQHGNQALLNAYLLSTAQVAFDTSGAGWLNFQNGFLEGDPELSVNPLYRGPKGMLTDSRLRNGKRRAGDAFRTATTTMTLTSDGYKGVAWDAGWNGVTTAVAKNTTYKICATMVEPSTNIGKREGGEQVWECTTEGLLGAEPTWPASPTAGVSTETSGAATFTFRGSTPSYIVEQVRSETKATTNTRVVVMSTDGTAGLQVVDGGGSLDGVDLVIPANSMVKVSHVTHVKKASTGDGGIIESKCTVSRDGTSAPSILSQTHAYDLTGASLDATTTVYDVNSNRVRLKITPESAEVLKVRTFRTQSEGVD